MATRTLRSICVFAGSSPGAREEYRQAAVALGHEIVARECTLVYGGGNVGLMGVLADAALEAGGHVIGIIPEVLVRLEVAHRRLSELRVVASMHERKAQMAELSDGVVALPGGLGTLEELFEMLTWAQLGMHTKPCGVLNVGGYFEGLLAFLDQATAHRFIHPQHRALLLCESEPHRLLDAMNAYEAPHVAKWIDRRTS